MTRDLGEKRYFRLTIHEVEGLGSGDFVLLTLPEGKLRIPVEVVLERFSTSSTWQTKGWHSSTSFPKWVASYRIAEGAQPAEKRSVPSRSEVKPNKAVQTLKRKSGVTDSQRKSIRLRLFELVEKISSDLTLAPEAVVLEMRYFHQSATNPYRTNASKADKLRSLKHYNHVCQADGCNARLMMKEAVFHHRSRGFAGQHEPANLVPYCEGCHDKEHDLPEGKSLAKGSRDL